MTKSRSEFNLFDDDMTINRAMEVKFCGVHAYAHFL